MAFEIPVDQIKELQLLLRKEVSLSLYEPEKEDPFTLPRLPSVSETIAGLDPSPPYLRCKHCKGKLLRGVQSSICVFCGTNPHKDLPPDPIKFKDTVGYRFLLDALQLDGSEMVGPINEGNDSSRARSASKEEIPLFELLDLEIIRPSELDRPQTSNADEAAFQSKGSLGLAAADLGSFFAQPKCTPDAFEDQLASEKLVDGATDEPFQTNENLSLFQNVLVPEKTIGPSEGQTGISFSGWEADFQSASSEAIHKESKSFDHSDVDLDEVFGYRNASLDAKKNDSSNPSASMKNDWFQGDMQRTSEVTSQTGKPEFMFGLNYAKMAESASSSTRNLDWMLADPGQESQNKTTDNVTTDEVADSLDALDDFTGSVRTQDPSSSVSNSKITSQTGEAKVTANLYDKKTAEGNHSSSTENFDWMQDDDLWPGSNDKTTRPVPTDEVTDTINAWDGFIGSAGTQDPSSSFPNSVMASQTERSEITADHNDRKVVESNSNFDWMGDDLWQGSYNKTTDTVTTEEVSGSFDDWNGFTSSAATQDHSSNVWEQTVNQTSSNQQTSEMDIFSLSSNSNVVNFGGFKQHDLFSEQSSDPLSSTGANIQTGAFSGRVASVDAAGGNSGDVSSAKVGSNVDDVEMLLSQMHDLSFMLESELSVPPK
ncbi:hypothetical protein QN277_002860 [Acacia crassicarpa]|uniref:DUF7815 domain-containing protein n=1 Tax=Acacia crassicarpa TaxID=499986 RepID=A0AAE1TII5_9FABA|nr:hypothetical protein QN277_002860 [Acacia crassicarpa]